MDILTHGHEHIAEVTDYPNGDSTWRLGHINNHPILVPSRIQAKKTCIGEAISLASFYRRTSRQLSNGGLHPPRIQEIIGFPGVVPCAQMNAMGYSALKDGYLDTEGNFNPISQYQYSLPNVHQMCNELVKYGSFAAGYKRFKKPKFKLYQNGEIQVMIHPKDVAPEEYSDEEEEEEEEAGHCVTIIGFGIFGSKLAWWAQDSDGDVTNRDEGVKNGCVFLDHRLISLCLYPYPYF